MLRILLVTIAALALTVPATAAELDPSTLVLRKTDVPASFRLDRDGTGIRSNEKEIKDDARFRSLFPRWGRLTGYEVEYDRGTASIGSRADIFRTPGGAEMMLDWVVLEVRKAGISGYVRSQVRLGAGGWMFRSRTPAGFTIVGWRSGRVFAGLGTLGLSTERTLALARAQQRRIAAALR